MSERTTKTQKCQGCGRRVRELRRVVGRPGYWWTFDPTRNYYGDPPDPKDLCFACAPPPQMLTEVEAVERRRYPWGLKNVTAKEKRARTRAKRGHQYRCGRGVRVSKTGAKRAHSKKADK